MSSYAPRPMTTTPGSPVPVDAAAPAASAFPAAVVRRARFGTALLFFVNAYGFGNLVPRLPDLKDALGLSNTALGVMVASFPVGALLAGLVAGRLIQRFGGAPVAVVATLATAVVLPLVGQTPPLGLLMALYFVGGALDMGADTGMNAHGLRVQQVMGRSIISGLHGWWSIGAVSGGLTGIAAVALGMGMAVHLAVAGALVACAAVVAARCRLPGPDPHGHDAGAAAMAGGDGDVTVTTRATTVTVRHFAGVLAVMGLVLVMAAAVEDTPATWGAVLLRNELGASAALAGVVYASFQASMTVGRMLGDRVIDRFGGEATMRAGAALAAFGSGVGLLVGRPWSVIVGFALTGIGTSVQFPTVYHAAGSLPGLGAGHGLAVVSSMSRVGFFVMPPLIGMIADASTVRTGMAATVVASLVVLALAPVVRPRSAG